MASAMAWAAEGCVRECVMASDRAGCSRGGGGMSRASVRMHHSPGSQEMPSPIRAQHASLARGGGQLRMCEPTSRWCDGGLEDGPRRRMPAQTARHKAALCMCSNSWHPFLSRKRRPQKTPPPEAVDCGQAMSSPSTSTSGQSGTLDPADVSSHRRRGRSRRIGSTDPKDESGEGSNGWRLGQAVSQAMRTVLAALYSLGSWVDVLGPAQHRQTWSVPWKGDTIFQVMFLWFMAFWFIGSWLIPVLTQLAGLNRAAMSLRAQALYSLSTDLAEMAVGLSILNRCLSRFRPLSAEWFSFRLKGKWYLDAFFACLLFPVVQLLSRLNTSLLPVSLKFPPSVRLEQSINSQDPIATLIYATTVAFCAPVWEEVVFRGFLLPSLTRYLPLWGAIMASAAIFSLAHFSLQRMLPLFFLGIVLGVVFARSQNLLTSILLHSLWNCFVFLDLLL